jgi:hypothetical protein
MCVLKMETPPLPGGTGFWIDDAMSDAPQPQMREMPAELRQSPASAIREARAAQPDWAADVWEHPWVGFALSAILPGIILSLLGPFGSFGAPLWMRFAYWMPTMAMGACCGAAITMFVEQGEFFARRPIVRIATITTAMTIAMTGVAWGMGELVFGPGAVKFSAIFVFYVWIITVIVSTIVTIIRARRVAVAAAPVSEPSSAGVPPLAARLPEKLKGGTILALEGEDHYVRVHTDKGSDLVLIRLTDAASEMGTAPRAQTHRSWWVMRSAVKSVRRDNGRVALVLTNGLEVPVSRGYASELREAGWLNGSG